MALARLALKKLKENVSLSRGTLQKQYNRFNNELVARFSTGVGDKVKSEGSEVAISEDNSNISKKKSKLLPAKRRGRRWLSRNLDRDFLPTPFGIFLLLTFFFSLYEFKKLIEILYNIIIY